MSPQIVVTTNEVPGGGSGVPTGTGTAFVAGATDAGPPPTGPGYVKCLSLTDYTNAFGPRSSTSSTLYDWLDEFFADGGQAAFVSRATDTTATTAQLTTFDGNGHPTVNVNALTAGVGGNSTYIQITAGTGPTFSASAGANQTVLSNVSSFANIGVGTPITGTGVPANTYVSALSAASATVTLTNAVSAGGAGLNETLTPGNYTVLVENSLGATLETHGPYYTTAALIADTSSGLVTFAQSAGGGFTSDCPTTTAATALAGGANASDLTDSSHVTALTNLPSTLGPGQVALPGKTSSTAWSGLLSHAAANNRFAILDMTDSSSDSSIIGQAQQLGSNANASYGMIIQGSLVLPGLTPGTTRTVPGSSAVCALRARMASTLNNNAAPAGPRWGLSRPIGFTEYYGPLPPQSSSSGAFQQADVNSLEAAGVNVFANYYGTLCLFGFVTPVSKNTDAIYWQATASCERMNLIALSQAAMAPYLFQTIDGAGTTISAMNGDLQAIVQNEWGNNALYGATAALAGSVLTAPPVNTAQTAAAGQLNAQLFVRISPFADTVSISISVVPLTQSVPQQGS